MMQVKNLLSITAALLVVLTLINFEWEFISNRWLRLITSTIFFLFVLKIGRLEQGLKFLVFGSFVLCDVLLFKWDLFSKYAYYPLHSLACGTLLWMTLRELPLRKLGRISMLEVSSLVFFFLVNSWILLTLGNYFSLAINDVVLETLFYINGFMIICLVISAFFYSTNFAGKFSSLFFLAVLGLTISDLFIFSIYFLEIQEFRYIDNLFYIFGLFSLLRALQEHKLWKEKTSVSSKEDPEEEKLKDSESGLYK